MMKSLTFQLSNQMIIFVNNDDQSEINSINFTMNNMDDPKYSMINDKIIFVSQKV